MMVRRLMMFSALTASLPVATARVAHGQECFAKALDELSALSSRDDTLALGARYESASGSDRCARLVAGYAIGMTSTPSEVEWRTRQKGSEMLDAAAREFGDEPRVYLAIGLLYYHRQARTDAMRMWDRALERKDRGSKPLTAREHAIIYVNRGLIHQDEWREWRSYGKPKATVAGQFQCGKYESTTTVNYTGNSEDYSWLFDFSQICPGRFDSVMSTYFEPMSSMKMAEFNELETALSQAIETDPTFVEPVSALLGEYVYLAMWDKAEPVARALYARLPKDYRSYVYLGLVLHETGRDTLAAAEFAKAFLYMPDSVAAIYDDIRQLLLPDQATWLEQATPEIRQRAVHQFWNSLDPLYLTVANERKLEHYGRVTTADLLFTSRALRERGWSSLAGKIWIRYGRPRVMRELPLPAGRAVFWDIGEGPDITFERGHLYESFRPTDGALSISAALARQSPQKYRGTQLVDSVRALGKQLVRFRGADGRPSLLVLAPWPEDLTAGSSGGVFLLNAQFQPIGERRGGKPDGAGFEVDFYPVPPGTHSVTVEAWDRVTKKMSRARDTVTVVASTDSLALSDILLAASIKPAGETTPTARRDLRIEPLYGSTLAVGQPLGLYWEVYGLKADGEGRARYDVAVEVKDAGQRTVLAKALSGIGIGRPSTEAASKIEYTGTRPTPSGRAIEWLELSSDLKRGNYRVVVTVRDRASNVSRTVERLVRVQ